MLRRALRRTKRVITVHERVWPSATTALYNTCIRTLPGEVANTATVSAYHPSVGTCLGQAAISAGEDLLGLSMLPGSDQDNWQWQSARWNSGFVYTGAGEVMDSSVGLDAVEKAADFVADNPTAQGTIRQFLRNQGVKWSTKHVARTRRG